jgi:hypothetical protein
MEREMNRQPFYPKYVVLVALLAMAAMVLGGGCRTIVAPVDPSLEETWPYLGWPEHEEMR